MDVGFGDVATPHGWITPRCFSCRRHECWHIRENMKDFFDFWVLARHFAFDGPNLLEAVRATFERRSTQLPEVVPLGLTGAFANDPVKRTQWSGFIRRAAVTGETPALAECIAAIRDFILPVLRAIRNHSSFSLVWPAGGPWKTSTRHSDRRQ